MNIFWNTLYFIYFLLSKFYEFIVTLSNSKISNQQLTIYLFLIAVNENQQSSLFYWLLRETYFMETQAKKKGCSMIEWYNIAERNWEESTNFYREKKKEFKTKNLLVLKRIQN